MKKLLSILLSTVCLFVSVCFAGCNLKEGFANSKQKVTYICGIVQTYEGDDRLYLSTPNLDTPTLLPDCPDGKIFDKYSEVYEKPLKAGDLVKIIFNGDFVYAESTDGKTLQYVKPALYMIMYKEHVALEKDWNDWLLTVDYEEYKPQEGEAEWGVGEYVTLRNLTQNGNGQLGMEKVGLARLENIHDGRMTFSLCLDGISIEYFLHNYATSSLTFYRDMPILDYSFSLTWNTFGISSYDSKTGKLVKTKDAPNPEDYITTHFLTAEE